MTSIHDLSLGIRGAVQHLWNAGYETSDSGDGSNLEDGMDCGWDVPMIVVNTSKERMGLTADSVWAYFRSLGLSPSVEASYSPVDGAAAVVVYGECLRNLP